MERLAYPAAHAVAQTVAEHFRRHASPLTPDTATMERLINAAFWASLRREEGRAPTISLAYLPPDAAGTALLIERPLPLDPATLTKLSPAVERPGIHLGVWKNGGGELAVWGATRTIPPLCFVAEVIEPGLLVIKHRRADPGGKFANVAVLEGDQVKSVDAEGTLATECPDFVTTLLGFDPASGDTDNVLLPLALSMRAHGHGGSLLVVPHGSTQWRKSIIWPVPYTVAPPFSKLGDLVKSGTRDGSFKEATDAIGGLTAVDGAVVLSDRWDVLAFGAKIGRTEAGPFVEEVLVREPILGHAPVTVHPSELGGTRHLSAAQFVHEQRDSLALVASQDGRFTVFGWSQRARMVHAYRVEALLL
ncbi:MAG: putative sensor domain DACNV-containing protein [Gemmatimonadales bacterium]